MFNEYLGVPSNELSSLYSLCHLILTIHPMILQLGKLRHKKIWQLGQGYKTVELELVFLTQAV